MKFIMVEIQVRFLHDPSKDIGFVGCALSSKIVRFSKTSSESWTHEVYISAFFTLVV